MKYKPNEKKQNPRTILSAQQFRPTDHDEVPIDQFAISEATRLEINWNTLTP